MNLKKDCNEMKRQYLYYVILYHMSSWKPRGYYLSKWGGKSCSIYYYMVLELWGNTAKSRNVPLSESLNVRSSITKGMFT